MKAYAVSGIDSAVLLAFTSALFIIIDFQKVFYVFDKLRMHPIKKSKDIPPFYVMEVLESAQALEAEEGI